MSYQYSFTNHGGIVLSDLVTVSSSTDLINLIRTEYGGTVAARIDDFDDQMAKLTEEIESINLERLPWDTSDYIAVFFAGILGGLVDVVLGKAGERVKQENGEWVVQRPEGYEEPKIRNEFLRKYDVANNPIDAPVPGKSLGDHRLYSYGHDLAQFVKGVRLIMYGDGEFGVASGRKLFHMGPDDYAGYGPIEAALILLIHLYKDFWTGRSLPIPGTTWIAQMNGNEIPKFIEDLYTKQQYNLRTVMGQALSTAIVELVIRLTCYFKYRKADVDPKLVEAKRDRMLLVGHAVALLFNLGKVVATKNPFMLNVSQIFMIIRLAVRVIKDSVEVRHNAILRMNLDTQRLSISVMKTAILTDRAVFITQSATAFFARELTDWLKDFEEHQNRTRRTLSNMRQLVTDFGELNRTLRE